MRKIFILIFVFIVSIFEFESCKTPEFVFPLESSEFVEEYRSHKWRSNKKYKYKDLIIKGRLSQQYKNKAGEVVIILARKKAAYGVSCTLENSEKQFKEPLKQNQLLVIEGFCIGLNKHVELKKCKIIKK